MSGSRRGVGLLVGEPHDHAPDDERTGDHPQRAGRDLDEVLKHQPNGRDRDRTQDDAPAQRVVGVAPGVLGPQTLEPGRHDADDVAPEVDDGRQDCPDLDYNGEGGDALVVDVVAEELLDDVEMTRRGDGQIPRLQRNNRRTCKQYKRNGARRNIDGERQHSVGSSFGGSGENR